MSRIIQDNFKCSTYWGCPCLVDEDGVYFTSVVSICLILNDQPYEGELVGVGSMSNMGHGCGSGYSQSGIYIKDLGVTIIPEKYTTMEVLLK